MPTYNALIAYDMSYYGDVTFEAADDETALAMLRSGDIDADGYSSGGDAFNPRVCELTRPGEDGEPDYVAEDVSLEPESTAPSDADKVEAALARIGGEWDNPKLVAFGPLSPNTSYDVGQILRGRKGDS